MQETIHLVAQYGYIILFFYTLGGGFVALVGASVLSYAGKMDLALVLVVASVANFLGDTLLFYLSRYQKKAMMEYLAKHRRKLAYVYWLMRRYGSIIFVFQKYIYGLKTLVPLGAGLTSYSFVKFSLINAVGSILWSLSFGLAGYFLGEVVIALIDRLAEYPYVAPFFIALLFFGLYIVLAKVTKKKITKE